MTNLFRWLLAAVMWRLQCWGWLQWSLSYTGGRWIDWEPTYCDPAEDGCGWRGPRRWVYHGYTGVDEDDVEPRDECPRCGAEI